MNPVVGPLWQFSVTCRIEGESAVHGLFERTFASPVSTYTNLITGYVSVTAFLREQPSDLARLRQEIQDGLRRIERCGLRIGRARIRYERVKRENWAESWKKHFKPLEIGGALLIKPSWSHRKAKRGVTTVILDPGLSFGTGHHATTLFCLEEIVRFRSRQRSSFLDVGSGSGILAISAAKLGYQPVHALEYDSDAIDIARANARRNKASIQLQKADVTKLSRKPARRYSLVCANLITDVLLNAASRIVNRVESGGAIIVAGILRKEFPEIRRCFERQGLTLVRSKSENEWRSGTFQF